MEALMRRVVLAVDRQKWLALAARFHGDQLSRSNQAFFVGEPYGFASFHSFVSCFQPSHANDGADNEIGVRISCYAHRSGGAVSYFDISDTCFIQARPKI